MKKNPDNLRIEANNGFSLIDILVGMVIALLGVIIIFQVFSVSEGVKRTTTSGGDAIQNGASALFTLERSLKGAGYGIFDPNNAAMSLLADAPGTAPVAIIAGGSPACGAAGAAVNSDCLVLKYRGDATYNWDYGSFPPNATFFGGANPPALTFETINVQIDAATKHAQLVSATIPDPTPGMPGGAAYVTLLPPALNTNNVISDGIVLMKVEYGLDTVNTPPSVVNLWTQTPPGNALQVGAVRLVLVARSAQPEDKDAAGKRVQGALCATTTVAPTWAGSTVVVGTHPVATLLDLSGNVGLAATDSWQCYRYKTFETIVPLRNVLWRPL